MCGGARHMGRKALPVDRVVIVKGQQNGGDAGNFALGFEHGKRVKRSRDGWCDKCTHREAHPLFELWWLREKG